MSTKHVEPKDAKPETAIAALPANAEAALALALQGGMDNGFEGTDSTDFLMPMLILLQTNSPQVNPAHAKYIPEAKPGMFLDVTTKEVIPVVSVIPCYLNKQMVEWKPERKGYAGTHEMGFEVGLPRDEKNRPMLPSGNLLVETHYFYCLRLKDDGTFTNVIIALTSTEIPTAKDWKTTMLSKTVPDGPNKGKPYPIYLWVCKITSIPKTKGANNWFGWKVGLDRMINQKEASMLMKAQEARTVFQNSAARMKPPTEAEDATPGAGDENKHL
jgi:hypothetical protein